MKPLQKKIIFFIVVLAIVCPIGIIVPDFMKSGEAWGEWSTQKVAADVGYTPTGMQHHANIYHAPVKGYAVWQHATSYTKRSLSYFLSAVIGLGIILLATFSAYFYVAKKQKP